ncbi:Uncharacterised protein [Vibrio cholerae]|nr:Uncharacterised protein [Vibrio cholerae]CSB66755.1 Uncharacterised protein [Vibrio cholerae]
MASFMHNAHQRLYKLAFVVACSNAHITRYAATEGVHTFIKSAVVKIKLK